MRIYLFANNMHLLKFKKDVLGFKYRINYNAIFLCRTLLQLYVKFQITLE